jgi:hypothetical protein
VPTIADQKEITTWKGGGLEFILALNKDYKSLKLLKQKLNRI